MNSRLISFGGSSIQIAYEGELAAQTLDFLFRDLAAAGGRDPHVTFYLEPGESDDHLRLEVADT